MKLTRNQNLSILFSRIAELRLERETALFFAKNTESKKNRDLNKFRATVLLYGIQAIEAIVEDYLNVPSYEFRLNPLTK